MTKPRRLIAYVYFYFGRALIANAPLYSGESSASDAPLDRAVSRVPEIDRDQIHRKLLLSTRIIIPRRVTSHPIVYNGESQPISDDSVSNTER